MFSCIVWVIFFSLKKNKNRKILTQICTVPWYSNWFQVFVAYVTWQLRTSCHLYCWRRTQLKMTILLPSASTCPIWIQLALWTWDSCFLASQTSMGRECPPCWESVDVSRSPPPLAPQRTQNTIIWIIHITLILVYIYMSEKGYSNLYQHQHNYTLFKQTKQPNSMTSAVILHCPVHQQRDWLCSTWLVLESTNNLYWIYRV